MTVRNMAWLTVAIWVIVFAVCIMFHFFGFLDKPMARSVVGGGVLFSAISWGIWALSRVRD